MFIIIINSITIVMLTCAMPMTTLEARKTPRYDAQKGPARVRSDVTIIPRPNNVRPGEGYER